MTDQQEAFTEWYESTDFFKSKRLRLDDKETRRAVFRNVWEQALVSSPPVLPAELKAGHMQFAAGVSLSTVAAYIERLQQREAKPMDPKKAQQLRALLDGIQRVNEEFEKGGDANGPDTASSNAQPGAAHPVNTPFIKDAAFFEAQRAIAASLTRATIPQGMRMVPVEPTEAMLEAGMKESPLCIKRMYAREEDQRYTGIVHGFDTISVGEIFKAMLAAAPQQPDEGGKESGQV